MQKNLFTKRWQKVKKPEPSELQIQIALIQRLGYMALPNAVYFHVPNGELKDPRVAAKHKAMGELPGVADLIFLYNRIGEHPPRLRVLCLELKAKGRSPSNEQRYFGGRVLRLGAEFEVADTIDRAVEILEKQGIIPPRN